MKQYLDIEASPLRNLSEEMSNDIKEQSMATKIQAHEIKSEQETDLWKLLYEKVMNSHREV